jgi:hypothetical protein
MDKAFRASKENQELPTDITAARKKEITFFFYCGIHARPSID